MTLGGVDESHYTGNITWVPVSLSAYWEFKVDSMMFGGQDVCPG